MPEKLINFQFNVYFLGIVFGNINVNLNEFTKTPGLLFPTINWVLLLKTVTLKQHIWLT